MRRRVNYLHDVRAASAAEFALVVPLLLIFLLGTIDMGRWLWNTSQAEKATQMGTRFAVVTDMVPSDLYEYSFAISGGVPQGTVVPQTDFPGVFCTSSGGVVSCQCKAACQFGTTADQAAFDRIVTRMRVLYGGIGPDNVRIDYDWSGLGYAGDPNGSDVDPIVTISLQGLSFRPIIFGTLANLGLPGTHHSLTMEDSRGQFGY